MKNSLIMMVYSAIFLIGFNVSYHVCQRSVPKDVDPFLSMIITFAVAFIISIIIFLLSPSDKSLSSKIVKLNWTSIVIGICTVGIILGHLFFYRSGWTLSTGTLFSYASICILLIPIGRLFFSESVSWMNYLGIFISLIGLYLIIKK